MVGSYSCGKQEGVGTGTLPGSPGPLLPAWQELPEASTDQRSQRHFQGLGGRGRGGGPGRPRASSLLTNTRRCRAHTSPTAPFCSGPHTTSAVLCFRGRAGRGNAWHSKGKGTGFGTPPESGGETEARGGGRNGARPEGARTRLGGGLFWGWHGAPRGLGVLVRDPGSSPQALSSLSRETCLLPPPEPECGLFILSLSCRHSSTFSAAVAASPPPESPGLHPSRRPGGGGGRWGGFFQPAEPSLSPLSLSLGLCPHCLPLVSDCP